eukprot:3046820-Amphidinium_carterae.1
MVRSVVAIEWGPVCMVSFVVPRRPRNLLRADFTASCCGLGLSADCFHTAEGARCECSNTLDESLFNQSEPK